MRTRIFAVASVAALSLGFAAPALAANGTDTLSVSFPPASDIGSSLGKYKEAPTLDVSTSKDSWYVCADVKAKRGADLAMAMYQPTPLDQRDVRADARTYASPAKAKQVFKSIAANLDKCTGSEVQESEPGSKFKWVVKTSVGQIPTLVGDGQDSLYVYHQQSPAKGSTAKQNQLGSSYDVLTLAGDTILVSSAMVPGVSKLTSTQQDAVVGFASDFLGTWSKAHN